MFDSVNGERAPISDRAATALVLAVWLGMLGWALLYVRTFAAPFPYGDEFALWDLLPPSGSLSLHSLWKLKNEHRIPLPRLLQYFPYVLTGDLRAPMYVQVLILSAVALLMITVARRIRGHTTWSDTLFPLVWLHTGNWENLLSGFQIALTLPTALVSAILAGIAVSPERAGLRRAIGMGGSLICLPLCGAAGLIQVPALGAWLAGLGWSGRKSADPKARLGSWILLASVGSAATICAWYFWGYDQAHWLRYSSRPAAVFEVAAQLVSLAFGPAAQTWWPAVAIFTFCVLVATLVLLLSGFSRRNKEIRRRSGLLAAMAGIGCLVASIGIGRADFASAAGFTTRYVTLTTPLLGCAAFAWILYGSRTWSGIVCGSLAIAAWVVLPLNARIGIQEGRSIRDRVGRFEELVGRGAGTLELVEFFTENFPFHYPQRSREILRRLAIGHKPPFDRGPAPDPVTFDYLTFSRTPSKVESDEPSESRYVDGRHVVLVQPGTRIHLELRSGETRVSGRFGIPSELSRGRKAVQMRVLVEAAPSEGSPRILLDRTLAPGSAETDRGSQSFRIDGLEAPGEIILRTESAGVSLKVWSWSYWSDIRIE